MSTLVLRVMAPRALVQSRAHVHNTAEFVPAHSADRPCPIHPGQRGCGGTSTEDSRATLSRDVLRRAARGPVSPTPRPIPLSSPSFDRRNERRLADRSAARGFVGNGRPVGAPVLGRTPTSPKCASAHVGRSMLCLGHGLTRPRQASGGTPSFCSAGLRLRSSEESSTRGRSRRSTPRPCERWSAENQVNPRERPRRSTTRDTNSHDFMMATGVLPERSVPLRRRDRSEHLVRRPVGFGVRRTKSRYGRCAPPRSWTPHVSRGTSIEHLLATRGPRGLSGSEPRRKGTAVTRSLGRRPHGTFHVKHPAAIRSDSGVETRGVHPHASTVTFHIGPSSAANAPMRPNVSRGTSTRAVAFGGLLSSGANVGEASRRDRARQSLPPELGMLEPRSSRDAEAPTPATVRPPRPVVRSRRGVPGREGNRRRIQL